MTTCARADAEPLAALLSRAGLAVNPSDLDRLVGAGKLTVNGAAANGTTPVDAGDTVAIAGQPFAVARAGIRGRLHLGSDRSMRGPRKRQPVRVHCGFHKCLTVFAVQTYRRATSRLPSGQQRGFNHFHHRLDAFYAECEDFRITSVSGHVVDLDRFDDIRVVRFVRDPRDLIVSGYFYHQRGPEGWCLLDDPVDADWAIVNGKVPDALPAATSMTAYVSAAPRDAGLAAEYEFRRNHFDTMRDWPSDSDRVRTFRYEDIMGRERETFADILAFLGLPWRARRAGAGYAHRHSAANLRKKMEHIRDATSGQWRHVLPAALVERMAAEYGDVLDRYGYPRR